MKRSEILQMLAKTQSDNFVDCGRDSGMKTYEIIQALMDAQDRYLLLRALQIAFALGRRSKLEVIKNEIGNVNFHIDELISGIQYDELTTDEERTAHVESQLAKYKKSQKEG